MKYNTATPYIASFVVLRRGNTVAFVLRTKTKWMNGYYGLPSGKVEKNESFTAAAIREAAEEAGVTVKASDLQPILIIHRHEPGSFAVDWVDAYFEVKKWAGEPYNAEPHKHGELTWLDLNNLPENIIPSVRFGLEQITAGNHYAEYGWE